MFLKDYVQKECILLKAFWANFHFVEDQLKLIRSRLSYFDMKNILTSVNIFVDSCFVSF